MDPARVCRDLGQRVLELRRAQGLTQEQLAGRLHVDTRVLRRLESGENTTVHTLVNVATVLGVGMAALFEKPKVYTKRTVGRPKKEEEE